MKTLFVFFLVCMCALQLRSQTFYVNNVNLWPEIPHEEKWVAGLMTSSNIFVSAINIYQFKNARRRANAGFLLFPGLIQLSTGVFFKERNEPTRNLDIAVGATSVLICVGRLLYFPKNKAREKVSLVPYCIPYKKNFASGLALRLTIN